MAGKRDVSKLENAHFPVVLDFSLLWHLITQVLVPHLCWCQSTHWNLKERAFGPDLACLLLS